MSECSNFDVIENLIEDGSATGTDWHIINNNGAFKILNNCSGEALFSILENGYIGLGEYYTSNVIGNYSNVNFVENFTNYIDKDIINTSNYVLYRTNILELTATSNNINISNYVRSTSNTLVNYNNLTNKLVQGNGILIQEGTNIISTIQNWTNISSNDIYYNSIGNVGIGTTPASKLHVYDEKNENAKLIVQNNIVNSLDIDTAPNVSSVSIAGVIDKYLKFTYTTDTYGLLGQTQYTFTIPDNVLCDILIIGGGGAGGYSLFGGGGGAGGYVYLANVTLSQDTYIINVGKGGSAIIGNGENGYNSSLANSANVITALGGGGGAGGSVQNGRGSDGGSGGGGSVNNLLGASVYTSGGNSTQNSIYGYGNGGNGNGFLSTSNIGGGGGGASGAALSGTGANGFENSITGIPVYYAAGGGAGTSNETLYNGGLGGGGRGGNIFGFFAISGTNGYGGGGGGGGGDEGGLGEEGEGFGGDGGSGVVIIRYKRAVSHVTSFSSSIELTRGVVDDSNTDYKIGNYNGDFKIISSTTGINTDALVINQNGNVGIGTITPPSKLYLYDDITTATKLTIQNNNMSSNAITSSSIELIRGTSNDNNPDYKIGNYNGDFKIISLTMGINTDALVINQNGNIGIGGNVTVGNVTATSFFGNGNGISGVLLTSNDTNLSNYVLSTSNILVNRIRTEESFGSNYVARLNTNASNYVVSTSNILVDRTRAEVGFGSNYVGRLNTNASNYVVSTSNILVDRIRSEVGFGSNYIGRLNANASNYVLLTSNILANRIVTEVGFGSNYSVRLDANISNYVLSTSNILVNRIGIEVGFGSNYSAILDSSISNYVLSTNDSLVNQIRTEVGFGSNYSVRLDANASNYVLSTSNILVDRIRKEVGFGSNYSVRLDANISNYVLSTNDSLANRITNLATDNITETINSQNKFVVNNRYNNNLLVNGTLTINSNLIILGDSTRLETIVYTTERLEIVNENTTSVALKIQQKDIYTDIFNASNSNAIVFTIANNGDVNISGTYKKNNRDILNDTSNYVLSTSNILVNRTKSEDIFGSNYSRRLDSNVSNYVVSTSNILINRIKYEDIFGSNYSARLDTNASNYVSSTSNILINIIDSVSSKWTITETGIYNNTANVGIGTSSPSNKLHIYNDTSNAIKLTIQNNIPPNIITSTPAATTTGYTNNYIYMVFTYTTDTTQFSGATQYTINVPSGGKTCDILMVGGGGAGGKEAGAGGGGGAVLYGTNISIPEGAYILMVGRGATPGEFNGTYTQGFGATILGGGSAGNYPFGGPTTANSGGSGSGHKLYSDFGVGGVDISRKGTILTDAKVYNGNIGSFGQFPPAGGLYGGGGGGAGSAGKESGDGGDGVLVNITGTNYYWGGGGGGGSAFNTAKNGGLGGGGAGIDYENYGNIYGAVDENSSYTIPIFMNGGQHTGGGGGGGGYASSTAGNGGSGIIILRYLESTSSSIELLRGNITDYNTDYKIGNYEGDFKIISSTSGINTDALVINQNGNLKVGGNVVVGNVTATSFFGNGNGISGVLLTSNDTNLSNYVVSTSNILVDRTRAEVGFGSNYVGRLNTNASNYVLSTSNILVDRTRAEVGFGSNYSVRLDANISNYVLSTSNILVDRIRTEESFGSNYSLRLDANLSNYVLSTSNILVNRIGGGTDTSFGSNYSLRLDANLSNYVLSTSNTLVNRIGGGTDTSFGSNYSARLDANISNYILSTSNILVDRTRTEVGFGSNYVGRLDANISNYVLSTSNILVNRIGTGGGGSSQWTTTGAGIYYNSNVGIGTSFPDNKLHLYNDLTNNTSLLIQNNFVTYTPVSTITPIPAVSTSGTITGSTDKFMIFTEGTYNFTIPPGGISCDILMIGGGGSDQAGYQGGGAGACIVAINQTLPAGSCVVNVGAGGIINTNGGDSFITVGGLDRYRAKGGGCVIQAYNAAGTSGGCGSGAGYNTDLVIRSGGTAATTNVVNGLLENTLPRITSTYAVLGNAGGNNGSGGIATTGGGGGIGAAGATAGNGGDGRFDVTINSITYNFRTYFANNTTFGVQDGTTGNYYIGGGGRGHTGSSPAQPGLGNLGLNTGGGGGSSTGSSGIIIIRYRPPSIPTNTSIELIRGITNDSNTDYKIGNYEGDFKIISCTSGINTDALVINQSSNVVVGGSVNATSFIGDGRRLSGLLLTSNDTNLSNYVLSTSNILVDRISSSSQWTTSNNSIYYNTSNVGIGTSFPNNKLHIYNDLTNNTSLLIQNNFVTYTPVSTITPIPAVSTSGTITGSTDKFMIFTEGTYNFTIPPGGISCDILMIGGGGADYSMSGGGGAGACIVAINQTLGSGICSVSIGSGAQKERKSLNGLDTTISVNSNILYRAMGGGTSISESNNGVDGGCGSGAGYNIGSGGNPVISNIVAGVTTGPIITTTYAVLANKGGDQMQNGSETLFYSWASAGGGGIGTAGQDHASLGWAPGKGGDGLHQVIINSQTYNFRSYFANNTSFGVQDVVTNNYYIGGGGGGVVGGSPAAGGLGGGSGEPGVDGIANTGSGGCGNYSGGGSGIAIIRYRVLQNMSSSIELTRGGANDDNTDYKIGNYNGDFKIISSTSGINTDALVINKSSNVVVGGSVNATSFIGDGSRLSGVLVTSNNTNLSNYILSSSNILVDRIRTEVDFGSNYIVSTSNILVNRIGTSSQWTTLNNNIYYNTSNVGIGTNIPNNKLHIYNNLTNDTSLLLQNEYINIPAIIEPSAILINSLDSGYKYFVFNYTIDNVPLDEDGDETPGITEYTFTLLEPLISAQVLIVGGGAAGGSLFGAGGGGGDVFFSTINIPAGVHNIRVGIGGVNVETEGTGDNGKYSSLILQDGTTYKYGGGGYGGNYYDGSSSGNTNNPGGGGGGAEGGIIDEAHLGSSDYLNRSGAGGNGTYLGGAGGGGGAIGRGGDGSQTNSGNGGQGMTIFFPESTVSSSYGGGGGGFGGGGGWEGGLSPPLIIAGAGIDGGGNGATNTTFAGNGINGRGGGGGGGSYSQNGLLLSKGGNGGHGVVIIKFNTSLINSEGNATIELVCGNKNDNNTDYKIGNYNGNFKIISSTSGINTNALVINQSSNIIVGGNVNAASFIGDGRRLSGILLTSNDTNLSNYVLSTSNILVDRISSSSSQWTTSNNSIYYNSNVGIGTSFPDSKLHLYDAVVKSTNLTIQNNYINTTSILSSVSPAPNVSGTIANSTDKFMIFTTATSNYTFTNPFGGLNCDILMIGGGGGAQNTGGGAGACIVAINHTLPAGSCVVVVGANVATAGINGADSFIKVGGFDRYRAKGGGGSQTGPPGPGLSGGCGSGAGYNGDSVIRSGGAAATTNVVNGTSNISPSITSTYAVLGNAGGNNASGGVITTGGGGGIGEPGFSTGNGGAGKFDVTINNIIYNFRTYFANNTTFGSLNAASSNYFIGGGGKGYNNTVGTLAGSGNSGLNTGGGNVSGGAGIIIIRYREEPPTGNPSIELIRGTNNDSNTDYKLGNYNGDFTIKSSVLGVETNRLSIINSGNVGIGTTNPGFLLEVATGTGSTLTTSYTYFKLSTALLSASTAIADICSKFNSSIWTANGGSVIASSDSRIKEDIQDINDDGALQSILAIEPKTYKYIDKVIKGNKKVYGFIAQQIREVIPEATSLQKSYIPNIMLLADYNNHIITLPSQPIYIIKHNDKIKCYDKDDKEIFVEVVEVVDGLTFKIKEPEKEYTDTKIFVYGTHIDDFHTLDKNYIYTLNVCATQELHRRIEAQNITIKAQEERIKELETKMVLVLNHVSI